MLVNKVYILLAPVFQHGMCDSDTGSTERGSVDVKDYIGVLVFVGGARKFIQK